MTELRERHCTPSKEGAKALTAEQARELLAGLHADWRLDADATGIRRDFRFPDFYRTMGFVNAIAHVANVEDHHPDLEVGYGYCRVRFSTHDVKGLSENDFICAAKVDALAGG
jgi:4a-hydroxytetrahydrobiopterin dehydratase